MTMIMMMNTASKSTWLRQANTLRHLSKRLNYNNYYYQTLSSLPSSSFNSSVEPKQSCQQRHRHKQQLQHHQQLRGYHSKQLSLGNINSLKSKISLSKDDDRSSVFKTKNLFNLDQYRYVSSHNQGRDNNKNDGSDHYTINNEKLIDEPIVAATANANAATDSNSVQQDNKDDNNNDDAFKLSQELQRLEQETMDRRLLFQYLKLKTYSDEEMGEIFDRIQSFDKSSLENHQKENESEQEQYQDSITESTLTEFIFHRLKENDSWQEQQQANECIIDTKKHEQMKQYANVEAKRIMKLLCQSNDTIFELPDFIKNQNNETKEQSLITNQQQEQEQRYLIIDKPTFQKQVRNLATKINTSHTIPISISMLLVGSSVGIVIPIMPYVVSNLGLSAGQYGIVVSSFALAKLFANVPAAIMVEKHGRKPYLVYSLVVISMGVAGIGLATQFEHLVLCRLLTGFGVSALSTAATLATADCSTPLNRASTMAPMMSSFAAGTALGPVIGGVLADRVGINSTFYLVGCIYLTLTAINNMALNETKEKERVFPWDEEKIRKDERIKQGIDNGNNEKDDGGVINAMSDAMSQWSPLLKVEKVRNVVLMNGFYWAALSGSQMTLLPLILTNPEGLAFTATQVGKVYMGMSLVQVLGNPTMATLIDKIGKVTGIVIGCTFLSTSMFILPYCTEMNEVVGTCGLWALGSTMLSTAPIAYVSDNVSDRKRAQAIALFRTAGDIGFLMGAISTGAMADAFDMDIALHSSAGMLLSATGWFTARSLIGSKKFKM